MPTPLTDTIAIALANLVNDSQVESREPTHSDLDFLINQAHLEESDPKSHGRTVGKTKRLRAVLSWAMEHNPTAGEKLVELLLSHLRACGGFRITSPNYTGDDPIANVANAFRLHGYELTKDGELCSPVISEFGTTSMFTSLNSYIERAKRGANDAALLLGTSKDLLEATAAHILVERNGKYPTGANFEGLIGMAYVSMDLSTPQHPVVPNEAPQRKTERAMFSLALSINAMRNKLGTGHGRPWLPTVSDTEARAAVQFMGTIAEWMLFAHERSKGVKPLV